MCRYSTGCTIHTELLSMLLCVSVSEAEFASSQKRSYKRFVVSWFTAASRFGYPIYVQHNIFVVYHSLRTLKEFFAKQKLRRNTALCHIDRDQSPEGTSSNPMSLDLLSLQIVQHASEASGKKGRGLASGGLHRY